MTYKEAVKKLRLKMLMNQEEFAKLLDVSFATINRWKTGKYVPTIKINRNQCFDTVKTLFQDFFMLKISIWYF